MRAALTPVADEVIDRDRIGRARFAYTTRRVDRGVLATILNGDLAPRSGDLVLARVLEIGQHERLELTDSRQAHLFPGDEIAVCYGNRYAPNVFEAEVPTNLAECELVAAGGVAATILGTHIDILRPPTSLAPIGLLGDADGRTVNLSEWGLTAAGPDRVYPPTIAVVGTQMDAGKTTTASYLIRGLVATGLEVGAAKITGTGAGKDLWFMRDGGAKLALDFTDAGFPSTYRATPSQVEGILITLVSHLAAAHVDAIVLEIADGLLEQETASVVDSAAFRDLVTGVVFAGYDSMGAFAGVDWLRTHRLRTVCVSGRLTLSPLATREAALATGLPVLDVDTLRDPALARSLLPMGPSLSA